MHEPLTLDEMINVVDDPKSLLHLQQYFGIAGFADQFTGRRFEALGGGGDRDGSADRVYSEDLVAVQLLSVLVPREVALDLLEGDLGRQVSAQLRRIPTDVDLGRDRAIQLLAENGPADTAWRLLEEPDGMGWVKAGKLLARKRPRLIPVYDRVVRCAFGRPQPMWQWLHEHFADRIGLLPHRLDALRHRAGLPEIVYPPRVLDVIMWMRHRESHRVSHCPGIEFE